MPRRLLKPLQSFLTGFIAVSLFAVWYFQTAYMVERHPLYFYVPLLAVIIYLVGSIIRSMGK